MNHDPIDDRLNPELAARITAMVLGEASDFETAQLHELIAGDGALADFHQQVVDLHQSLTLFATSDPEAEDRDWKLSPSRRQGLLAVIDPKGPSASESKGIVHAAPPSRSTSIFGRKTLLGLVTAACLAFFVGALLLPVQQAARMANADRNSAAPATIAEANDYALSEGLESRGGSELQYRYTEDQAASPLDARQRGFEGHMGDQGMGGGGMGGMGGIAAGGEAFGVFGGPAKPAQAAPQSSPQSLDSSAVDSPNEEFGRIVDSMKQQFGYAGQEHELNEAGEVDLYEAIPQKRLPTSRGEVLKSELRDQAAQPSDRKETPELEQPARRSVRQAETGQEAGQASDPVTVPGSGEALLGGIKLDTSPEPLARSRFGRAARGVELDDAADNELFELSPQDGLYSVELGVALDGEKDGAITKWNVQQTPNNSAEESSLPQLNDRASITFDVDASGKPESLLAEGREFSGGQIPNFRQPTDGYFKELQADSRAKGKSVVAALDNERSAQTEPFSTFSLHVSDASFQLANAALSQGQWPDATSIRIEEFVNALDYHDPSPSEEEKVACQIEQGIHPFMMQRNLMRLSMKTSATGRSAQTPLRLTLLLDNSGSMQRPDRRDIVRQAFKTLANQLNENDQVTLICFASQPRLLADRIVGNEANGLVTLVENLPSEGGTNLEVALQLAFEKAREQQVNGAQNRIVLLTDGAVNLGDADPENLQQSVVQMRDAGIAFDAAGIGLQDLNDEVLESLTRNGDGRYYVLDSVESAGTEFASKIAGALRPAAKNVKVQVEFNPQRVGSYKLLGFEKHLLNQEDFRNDQVDAAELAAEEAGVAVYQFEPKPNGSGDIGSVSVRFQDLSTGLMVEKRWPIVYQPNAPRMEDAPPSMRMAAAAALLAAKLQGDALGDLVDLKQLTGFLADLPNTYSSSPTVIQLREMLELAKRF